MLSILLEAKRLQFTLIPNYQNYQIASRLVISSLKIRKINCCCHSGSKINTQKNPRRCVQSRWCEIALMSYKGKLNSRNEIVVNIKTQNICHTGQ